MRQKGREVRVKEFTSKLTLLSLIVSVFTLLIINNILKTANAAQLPQRSIIVQSPIISAVNVHEFNFDTISSNNIGSIKFQYCNNSPLIAASCTAPTGLNVSSPTLLVQSLGGGFSVNGAPDTNANTIVISRNPAISGGPANANFDFGNIVNQSAVETAFVKISTHSSLDGSGVPVDFGSVAYVTTSGFGVNGYVPPYLTFCVGVTVAPDCTVADGSLMSFGELSSTTSRIATSQFAGATNAPTGYNTYVAGGTMTAGNEIIPALSVNSPSITGVSQFGINLRSNSAPSAGADVTGTGTMVPTASYNSTNSYRYVSGERISTSPIPTNYNRFTVTYLVNVAGNQRPGVYASSYTYTAIANF